MSSLFRRARSFAFDNQDKRLSLAGFVVADGSAGTGLAANIQLMEAISVSSAATVNSQGGTTAIINGAANGVGNIGTTSRRFNTVFAKASSAQYADLAENYLSDAQYETGTVVEFGGEFEITLASDETRRVAGVISTNPAYLMNTQLNGAYVLPVALQGRVPCKVRGKIHKGDMLVSGGDGYARPTSDPKIGTVIGKALEDFEGTDGVIEVVVGRV